ncbi:MAG: translocation/assembly module TamB domain-containing protein, partial [Planctomycetota bacterium]
SIASLDRLARELTPGEDRKPLDGQIDLQATFGRAGADDPIRTSGTLHATAVTYDQQDLIEGDSEVVWTRVAVDAEHFVAEAVSVDSGPFGLDATGLTVETETKQFTGDLRSTAHLARCLAVARVILPTEDWPDLDGMVTVTAQAASRGDGDGIVTGGSAQISPLRLDGKRLTERPTDVTWTNVVVHDDRAVSVEALTVNGQILRIQADDIAVGPELSHLTGAADIYADLGPCLALLGQLSPDDDLPAVRGAFSAQATFESLDDGRIQSSGQATLTPLQINDRAVTEGQSLLNWKALALHLETDEAALDELSIQSSLMELSARDLVVALDALRFEGAGELAVDLGKCLLVAAALKPEADLPDLSGQLTWSGQAAAGDGRSQLTGRGQIADLAVIRADDERLDLQTVTWAHAMTFDRQADAVAVEQLSIDSRFLTGELTGSVGELHERRVLDLSGQYQANWEELLAIAEQLSPGVNETVSLTGHSAGPIVLTGPINDPTVEPGFKNMTANTELGWQQAVLAGITFDQASIRPELADGRITIPTTTISALEGAVTIGGVVDLTGDDPVYHLPGPVTMLDTLHIDQQLSQELLTRFNPIFANQLDMSGLVTLRMRGLVLPLSEAIKTSGAGRGWLNLQEMNLIPRGMLLRLLQMAGTVSADQPTAMQIRGVDFTIRDGRIHYDNFVVVFPAYNNFDLKFYGSVGFDDTLDLVASLPVRAGVLEQLGVRGKPLEYVHLLEGVRIDVPVRGTRTEPTLDFAEVDIRPLLGTLAEKILKAEAAERLRDLLDRLP